MSCVVGIAQDGRVWMGGDGAGSVNNIVHIKAPDKVFKKGPFLMGSVGSGRLGDVLRYSFNPPDIKDGADVRAYLSTDFGNALRECMRACGFLQGRDSEEGFDGRLMVGIKGRLFYMDGYFSVQETLCGWLAIGCAEEAAMAVLMVTPDMQPEPRLMLALETAANLVNGVRPPFAVECLG